MATDVKKSVYERFAHGLDDLNPQAARGILRVKLEKPEQRRIHELSQRAQRGQLTREEQVELDGYLQLGSILTLMHSKARMALKRPDTPRQRRKTA